jgi:hypothetical protein
MESVIRLFPHRKDNAMRIGIGSFSGGGALSNRAECPIIRARRTGSLPRFP